MKKLPLFSMALLLAGVLFAQSSRAEDYTRLNLPDDALARLGKGIIRALYTRLQYLLSLIGQVML